MINFNNIGISRGQRVLFGNATFTLHDRQRVGLIGANGSGKTSLFSVLLNELEPTEGEVSYKGQLEISHVKQEITTLDCSALDFVLQGDREYYSLIQKMEFAEQNDQQEDLAEIHMQLSTIDGYGAPARAAQLLAGLGFSEAEQQQPVASFSGGWRMRLNLAQALMCRSDVLLLDEPTNHLDLEAIVWLEKWLNQYLGLLIIISHDRDFLDKTINFILHIEKKSVTLYKGDYSSFEEQRATQLSLQQATYEKQQRQIKHLMKFVDRFRYKASKAKQAQSRLKAVERMEKVTAVQVDSPFHFEFKNPEKCPYPILRLEHVCLGYDDKVVLNNIDWQLIPGDRVALLGYNGAGKSTLIKALAGKLTPKSGVITLDGSVKVGYFSQHQLETLKPETSALDHMQALSSEPVSVLRKYLGGFGFSGDEALKPVVNFSGGEKARLVLAMIVWQRPNLLLLDEPTNHLDMEMRMALTLALQSFEGAMVLIAHDHYLLSNTVDQLWVVENQQLTNFDGTLDDYYQMRLASTTKNKSSTKKEKSNENKPSKKTKPLNPIKIKELEKNVTEWEEKLRLVGEQLADPALYKEKNHAKRESLYAEQQHIQQQLKHAEEEWLSYLESNKRT